LIRKFQKIFVPDVENAPDEELIPLTRQDRTLWDQAEIAEGIALLPAALSTGSLGAYQLQAAIAAVHDEAAGAEDTDWPQILALYELLKRMSANPMAAGPATSLPERNYLAAQAARLSDACWQRSSCSRRAEEMTHAILA
jgi:predicted RNA polymerase sigma factor